MAKEKKASPSEKRSKALEMYLNTDLTQKEICEIVGWSEGTFKENKEKYGWEALKGAQTITAQNIIKKLYLKLEELVDDPKGLNADALIKVSKSIEMMTNKKVTVSHHINCAKEFTVWLFAQKPDLAKEFNRYQRIFINEMVSNG